MLKEGGEGESIREKEESECDRGTEILLYLACKKQSLLMRYRGFWIEWIIWISPN